MRRWSFSVSLVNKSKARSHDAWLEGMTPKHPTQFLALEPMDKVVR